MADIEKKVSGFGFVDFTEKHTYVYIYKTSEGKYFTEMEFVRSSKFDSLNDMKALWNSIKEIEETRKLYSNPQSAG